MGQFYFQYNGSGSTSNRLSLGLHSVDDVLNILGTGNIGIGTASPSANFILDINSTKASGASGMRLTTQSTSAGPIFVLNYTGSSLTNWGIGAHQAISGALEFVSSNSAGGDPATAGTTRMMIASGGNVLIGTTTDAGYKFDVNGNIRTNSILYTNDNGPSIYQNRINGGWNTIGDSIDLWINYEGYLNSTSYFRDFRVGNGKQGAAILFIDGSTRISTFSHDVQIDSANGLRLYTESNGASWYIRAYNAASNQFRFNYQGSDLAGISAVTGVYTALSDVNKKKDFEESTIGLNEVLGLKPTLYRMKTENDTADKHLGFIAQEVKNFIPQAYSESGDFIGLDYNPIVAALVKSVQELKAELDELKNKN